MSGYEFLSSSKPFGMIRTGHELTRDPRLALKQRTKYPGCLASMQKAYVERLGLASMYVVSHFSAPLVSRVLSMGRQAGGTPTEIGLGPLLELFVLHELV